MRLNKEKVKLNRKISALKSLNTLSRQHRRMLAVLQNNVNGMIKGDLWNRAFNLNISYETMGEQASGWLLRGHISKRGCAFIQELSINGKISNDTYEIEECAKKHFYGVYNTEDSFRSGDVENFMQEEIRYINKISKSTKDQLNKEFSLNEIIKTFEKIKDKKSGGLDGLTSRLFHFIVSFLPKFLAACIKYDILQGNCADNKVMIKKLILIEKSGNKKRDLKR